MLRQRTLKNTIRATGAIFVATALHAIAVGNINSGGNVGNAISVGDTACAPYSPEPVYEAPVYEAPVYEEVVALPSTGVGAGEVSGLFALLASAGAAVTSLGLRRRG